MNANTNSLEKPIVNNKFLLEKYPGKGGWTFARINGITKTAKSPFGWKKVRGTIDSYEIRKYHLMPMGDGNFFLPVKAEIRKAIHKTEGDRVHIVLYPDNEPLEVPEELLQCLQDEPSALHFFNSLSESEKKFYIQWIYSAKQEQTKINRMAKSINRLAKGLKLYAPEINT